ncbi:hypothetical protein PRZ48_012064 [Zasmidium cellare]|uniref:Uncharacterized protein n=1 Tax=Zasmidium cellare TaxID=395010 RepID=A0ABR0E3T4_ZASCE|nr:hypothetical protein PRZ48_012064 [Zasmidium cellare]
MAHYLAARLAPQLNTTMLFIDHDQLNGGPSQIKRITNMSTSDNQTNAPVANPNRPNEPGEPTPFGTLFTFPAELRVTVWEMVVYSEQGGIVDFHQPCRHPCNLPVLSQAIQNESRDTIRAARGTGCRHVDFRIVLPDFEEMDEDTHEGRLIQAIEERDGLAAQGRGHDITRADTIVFETGHFDEDDAPDTVTIYLERGGAYYDFDVQGGSQPRVNHISTHLHEIMPSVKRALELNTPIPGSASADEEDDGQDPAARARQIKAEAMTYLAEQLRIAIDDEIEEWEVAEPRLMGPSRRH